MSVPSNQAYLVAVVHERWAGSRNGFVVLEGEPVADADLELVEGTVVTGRLSRGPEKKAIVGESLMFRLEGTLLPDQIEKLTRNGAIGHRQMSLVLASHKTDADGRFRFVAGPGDYVLFGSRQIVWDEVIAVAQKTTKMYQQPLFVEHTLYARDGEITLPIKLENRDELLAIVMANVPAE